MIEAIEGKLVPLNDNVLVTDMNFEEQKTASGIIIQSDDGKSHGVKPRWCRVWAVGPEQKSVKVGDWILVEHGRWTRGVKVKDNGQDIIIRRVETVSIMLQSDSRPSDVYLGQEYSDTSPMNIRPEDFM